MTRVCLVKQHTTYDLFTRTGPDLSAIVASSNWRSGPLGLWEAFDTTARIVVEDPAPECQLGKSHWRQYVQGWDIWPEGGIAEDADGVDWNQYDVVISVDVAVPTRIVKRFPSVMWCYYFIEGGPTGIDGQFRGSPYYGYNVFLNHRLAKSLLSPASPSLRHMRATHRAVLDFPYYMQSGHSVRSLHPELARAARTGVCLSHHSREVLTRGERAALMEIGPVRSEWRTISDIHKAEIQSTYFLVHPSSSRTAGLALIEAISAGCLALAPRSSLWGFPDLVVPGLEFETMGDLMGLLWMLERNPEFREEIRARQERLVDEWCFSNPARNLEVLLAAFRSSQPTSRRQRRSELSSRALASVTLTAERAARRIGKALRRQTTVW